MMLLATVALVTLQCCLGDDLIQTLVKDSQQSTLVSYVTKAGLASTLSSGVFTIFAPTDEAFAKVPQAVKNDLMAHPDKLAQLLKYHVVAGRLESRDIHSEAMLDSLNGAKIRANVYSHNHAITVQGARVTKADQVVDNGVIHVIDHVIMPPSGSVVDAVAANKNLSTLLTAVKTSDLVDALKGQSQLTLLAPTNDAFARLDNRTLSYLLTHKSVLQQVLLYHVVPYTIYSVGIYNHEYPHSEDRLKERLSFSVGKSGVTVNREAHVTQTDISVSNGVVHLIDHVLIPGSIRLLLLGHAIG